MAKASSKTGNMHTKPSSLCQQFHEGDSKKTPKGLIEAEFSILGKQTRL